ncbi:Mammalian cell entry related domain protein [Chloroherpeton thalassium ATCC 35110]|uniref:Mammalian cell entry related domain protein n=1 Tax=Chloroherpeton thalassium (strain ATCC 35110 / GB-78) TaxID=517418 RepID=B3QS87_CHLT3|nr:MlaD family protein [Chloroherpeton thalassium]ACF14032.1 Mammalian cell entry related domain protein [Chloroherpeton thalassium ATCC 35110]
MGTSSSIGWKDLKTGILFVFGIGLFAVLGLVIGKNTSLLTGLTKVYIFVEDLQSLAQNNFVAVSGKKVGTVTDMGFETRNDKPGVVVQLSIRTEYIDMISKNSEARIKSLGVLGDKYVDIRPGSGSPIEDGDFLQVVHEPSIDDLSGQALSMMTSLNQILQKINQGEGTIGKLLTTTELLDKLDRTVANLEQTTNMLTNGNGLVSKMLTDGQMADKVSNMVTNLNDVSLALKDGKGSLGKLMVDESFYNNLNAVTQRADALISHLDNPNGTLGKLANDPTLYANLNRTVNSLDSLLVDLKQNPSRYVKLSLF